MCRLDHVALIAALLAFCGCAARQPAVRTWRLLPNDGGQILVPPDVASPDLAQRTFAASEGVAEFSRCPSDPGVITMKKRGRQTQVTVTREGLEKQPTGWLGEWASQLEARGCVRPGSGMALAARVVESVPLEPASAVRLLYPDDRVTGAVDAGPYTRFRVVSPIWRDPKAALLADNSVSVTGKGYSLTVTAKSADNLLGYETALYAVEPKDAGIGYTIVPREAERHIGEEVEHRPQPTRNYFLFPPGAAFYRVFYKAEDTDFTALILAAATPAELDQRTEAFRTGGASATCEDAATRMCAAIPKEAGLNTMIAVTVNGKEVLVSRGGNVRQAIRASGEPDAEGVAPELVIYKPWNGRLVEVDFDRANEAILRLVLAGGERISWP